MNHLTTLIGEAKNKLDEIQDSLDRGNGRGKAGAEMRREIRRLEEAGLTACTERNNLRKQVQDLTLKLAGYKRVVARLTEARAATREVLRAKKTERTARAARRALEAPRGVSW